MSVFISRVLVFSEPLTVLNVSLIRPMLGFDHLLLLRVASTMSDENTDVNIIPEFPIAKTVLAENRSFGGVVDFLMAKLPARYSSKL